MPRTVTGCLSDSSDDEWIRCTDDATVGESLLSDNGTGWKQSEICFLPWNRLPSQTAHRSGEDRKAFLCRADTVSGIEETDLMLESATTTLCRQNCQSLSYDLLGSRHDDSAFNDSELPGAKNAGKLHGSEIVQSVLKDGCTSTNDTIPGLTLRRSFSFQGLAAVSDYSSLEPGDIDISRHTASVRDAYRLQPFLASRSASDCAEFEVPLRRNEQSVSSGLNEQFTKLRRFQTATVLDGCTVGNGFCGELPPRSAEVNASFSDEHQKGQF